MFFFSAAYFVMVYVQQGFGCPTARDAVRSEKLPERHHAAEIFSETDTLDKFHQFGQDVAYQPRLLRTRPINYGASDEATCKPFSVVQTSKRFREGNREIVFTAAFRITNSILYFRRIRTKC